MEPRYSIDQFDIEELNIEDDKIPDIRILLRWRFSDRSPVDPKADWTDDVRTELIEFILCNCERFADLSLRDATELCANLWFDWHHLIMLETFGVVLIEIQVQTL